MNIIKPFLSLSIILFSLHAAGENRTDKLQTYVLETPYEVQDIQVPETARRPKNVILMIGDGMSLMHVYTAWAANRGALYITDSHPHVGLAKALCVDRLITDSGAGGTFLATGKMTRYHSIGVDAEGQPVPSLVDFAKDRGMGAGMAFTCRIWDATPSDFNCHQVDRDKEFDVAADYAKCRMDYVCGGGWKKLVDRPDGRNIMKELEARGYHLAYTWDEARALQQLPIFALTDEVDTPLPADRGDRLAQSTLKGLDLLKVQSSKQTPKGERTKGFFFMVEGSQLDDYGHFNDLPMLMQETHDFDRTVGAVLEWAARDGETLVVVTADHETGGLTLVDGNLERGEVQCKFSTTGHSGLMVPVYAYGPGASLFDGVYTQGEVNEKIQQLLTK